MNLFKKYVLASVISLLVIPSAVFAQNEIFKAVQKDDKDKIQSFLNNNPDLSIKDESGDTLLAYAAKNSKKPQTIDMLAQAGANIEIRDKDGHTPLMAAVIKKPHNTEVILALIRNNANVNAAYNNKYDDDDQNTALFFALKETLIEPAVIMALLDKGADVNGKNAVADTPLITAARHIKNPDIINILVRAGARINAKDQNGYSPLMIAVQREYEPQISLALIKNGADVNASYNNRYHDKDKTSVLMFALEQKNTDPRLVQALIDYGAKVNMQNASGTTPLLTAAERTNKEEIINILISAGAQKEQKSKDGYTPLMKAVKRESEPYIAIALIKNGADVNALYEKDLSTPLMIALEGRRVKPNVIQALTDYGAAVNTRDRYGRTPLMIAARNTNEEIVRMLLKAGADNSITDIDGNDANYYAMKNSRLPVKNLNTLK